MKIINEKAVNNKTVLLRVDYNIDLDEKGKIVSDFRIRASLPTIEFLLKSGARKIVLMSHLGRPKGKNEALSLKKIAIYLERLLNQKIVFIDDCISEVVKEKIKNEPAKIFLLENLRFYSGEETNDPAFAKQLASIGEVYINDAFGASHRLNASVAAITDFLPSYAGFLMAKEVETLSKLKENFERPFVVVLGGAKISTKLPLINKFLNTADYILLGGGLANTIWKGWGFEIGRSLVEESMLNEAKNLGSRRAELIVPGDVRVTSDFTSSKSTIKEVGDVKKEDIIVDIGSVATNCFVQIIKNAKTILWNGPMGYWENEKFREGTKKIAKAIAKNKNFTVVGGGETLTVVEELGLLKKYNFVSTGGGAMLEFLISDELPALKLLR